MSLRIGALERTRGRRIVCGALATEAQATAKRREIGVAGQQINGISASLALADHWTTFRGLVGHLPHAVMIPDS